MICATSLFDNTSMVYRQYRSKAEQVNGARERKGSEVDATLNLLHFTITFRSARATFTVFLDPIQTD